MDDYTPSTFGDRIAGVYDRWHTIPQDADEAVEFLATLSGRGPVLELGIGTGRVALPLASRGIEVHGIDASEEMVARLREKPGGAAIPVTIGDFADVAVEGSYGLVFVVFNTIWALLSPQDQQRCVAGVARRLAAGGAFVVQAMVPDPSRFDRGQRVGAAFVGVDEVVLEASKHDAERQRADSQYVVIREEGISLYPVRVRYIWPSELDLMAELAGLRLRERWGGWHREPFGADSTQHVSVYEPAS